MIPPLFLVLVIGKKDGHYFRLWFPLIILWPFLIAFFIILLPFAAVSQIALGCKGIRPLSMIIALVYMLLALRGLEVYVKPGAGAKESEIKIKIS